MQKNTIQTVPFATRLSCAEAGLFFDPNPAIEILKQSADTPLNDFLSEERMDQLERYLSNIKAHYSMYGDLFQSPVTTYREAAVVVDELYKKKADEPYEDLIDCLAHGHVDIYNERQASRAQRTYPRNSIWPVRRDFLNRTPEIISLEERFHNAEKGISHSFPASTLTVPRLFQAAELTQHNPQMHWFYQHQILPLEKSHREELENAMNAMSDTYSNSFPDLDALVYWIMKAWSRRRISEYRYDELLRNTIITPFL